VSRLLLLAGAVAAATGASGQYALDKNQRIGGSGVNAYAPRPAVQRDVYTVNRNTGTYTYNRANAFSDTTYSIHERYINDRVDAFVPAGVSTGAGLSRPSQPAATRSVLPGSSASLPRYTGVSRMGRESRVSTSAGSTSVSSAPPVARSSYSVARPTSTKARSTGLAAPTYSVAR
jgi:hypothetical protein